MKIEPLDPPTEEPETQRIVHRDRTVEEEGEYCPPRPKGPRGCDGGDYEP